MAKNSYQISKEIKEQIISRIKNDGISVQQASEDHGVKAKTIYYWLGTKAKGTVTLLEHNKLKKENQQLKEIIGDLTVKMSVEAKKGLSKVW